MEREKEYKIICKIKQGDKKSYSKLVDFYESDVRHIIVFALYDKSITDDLVQQTFVNAWFMLDTFDESREFGPWIRTIARNLVKNEMRSFSRRQKHLASYQDFLIDTMENEEETSTDTKYKQALLLCSKQLNEVAAKALKLRYEDGLSFDVIAKKIGRTLAGSRQLLTRVRGQLKTCISTKIKNEVQI